MLNVFDIFVCIKALCDNARNSSPTPEEAGNFMDMAQQQLYAEKRSLLAQGDNEAAAALAPFRIQSLLTSSATGLLTYPADWASTEGIYETISRRLTSVTPVQHKEIEDALKSTLYPIASNPRYIEEATGIQLYPEDTHSVSLHYVSKPTTPVIGYTVSGNTYVYNAATSTQLQFATNYYTKIVALMLPYVGLNLSDAEIIAAGQQFNNVQAAQQ